MKSKGFGRNISKVEVSNISPNGLWILAGGKEYFLPHREFPWFENASLRAIHDVRLLHQHHLYWESLDIDLELESLENLEKYPLKQIAV